MKTITSIILVILLSGCSTMQPPRYSVSVDNIQELRKYPDAKLMISNFSQSAVFSPNCRLMGPIEPADGLSLAEFIRKAFNDELKMANIYSESENDTKIFGDITSISFSSAAEVTRGYWDIAISLTSSNGHLLNVANKHKFQSGFDAFTACNATADALVSAVQDLIKATITDPRFAKLLSPTGKQ